MGETKQHGFKRWEDLDITDDFIFTRAMRNKKLCRPLRTSPLPRSIAEVTYQWEAWGETGTAAL